MFAKNERGYRLYAIKKALLIATNFTSICCVYKEKIDLFEIKLILYGLSSMLQFSQFIWSLSYSVWDVFNNFLLIDATDRSKISCDQKRFFIALSLYPLSFFANTPFKNCKCFIGTKWILIFFFTILLLSSNMLLS